MKKKILIGFLNRQLEGAIPTVTKAFIDGLNDKYEFIPFYMDRKNYTKQTKLNVTNIYYLLVHYIQWVFMLLKSKPDIVHFPVTSYWNLEKSLLFLTTAKLIGKSKIVGHLHGGAFQNFWESLSNFRKKIDTNLLNNLNRFIVLSKFWEETIINNGMDKEKVFIVNNPIDVHFEENFFNYTRNYYSKKNNFISISGLTHKKGIQDTLKGFDRNDIFTYNIIGNEIESGFLSTIQKIIISNELQNNVHILGKKYGVQKINLLKEADIYILPSYIENFPLAIIEAACAGLPIITTPVGALPEFFSHMDNIFFVEAGNINQIRYAIKYLITG